METLEVKRISPDHAAIALGGVAKHDPRGITTAQDLKAFASGGECFAIRAPGGEITYLMRVENGQAWVQAAQAIGNFDFGKVLSPIIESQVREVCHSIAFQTARRGLVRKAQSQGYKVTGWILKKDIE